MSRYGRFCGKCKGYSSKGGIPCKCKPRNLVKKNTNTTPSDVVTNGGTSTTNSIMTTSNALFPTPTPTTTTTTTTTTVDCGDVTYVTDDGQTMAKAVNGANITCQLQVIGKEDEKNGLK